MASPSPTPSSASLSQELEAEDAHAGEMPLTMAASVVLDHLPKDAHKALDEAGKLGLDKSEFFVCSIPLLWWWCCRCFGVYLLYMCSCCALCLCA